MKVFVRRQKISNLGEYLDFVSSYADDENFEPMKPPILWFRGQSNASYSLVPSLYRMEARADKDSKGNYSRLHYAEDIRTQHYIAKNYHLLTSEPSSRVEWLEVMQHHQVNTRVLDWSESSIHSLLFALEPFFENEKGKNLQRANCSPCVWILNPGKLNKKILQYIKSDVHIQEILLSDLGLNRADTKKILNNIKLYGDFDKYAETKETKHIDYIFNLSSLNDEILRDRSRLRQILLNGEITYPYYYLLSRIYSDSYLLETRDLPPLSVVQSYHSERIKAQKGVFTVFPVYREHEGDDSLRYFGVNPDAMDRNNLAKDCLCQVLIMNPQKVALQLLENGMNTSWLYPEMPVVSSEIENHKIF